LASSGASAAYLTVSEIFPMETRALAIAFFYAVGTAAGGIVGPLLFGTLIDTGERMPVAVGFLIAAAVMSLGGLAELLFGARGGGGTLEDPAPRLTAGAAAAAGAAGRAGPRGRPATPGRAGSAPTGDLTRRRDGHDAAGMPGPRPPSRLPRGRAHHALGVRARLRHRRGEDLRHRDGGGTVRRGLRPSGRCPARPERTAAGAGPAAALGMAEATPMSAGPTTNRAAHPLEDPSPCTHEHGASNGSPCRRARARARRCALRGARRAP